MKIFKLRLKNEELEMKLKSKDQEIESLESQKDELELIVTNLNDKIKNYKQ